MKNEKPNPIVKIWRKFIHKRPGDYESPFESVLTGVLVAACVPLFMFVLAMVAETIK